MGNMKERWLRWGLIGVEAGVIGLIARLHYMWPLALILVTAIEVISITKRAANWPNLAVWRKVGPRIVAAWSFVLLVAVLPRAWSQVILTIGFVAWRWWLEQADMGNNRTELAIAMGNQFLSFWSVFVAAAIWHWPKLLVLVVIWLVCYLPTRLLLEGRNDLAKAVVAAVWALVAAEVSWVSLSWFVSYVVVGGIIIVPQPAIVLTGLGYCYGSIYLAQREGRLSRRRLSEYVVIAAAILVIVTVGTNWRGTI